MTSIQKILLFIPLIATIGCSSGDSTTVALKSGILFENIDSTANPGDDFHQFVNGMWLKNNEIPSDRSGYGVSAIISEQAEENVKAIIEESASGEFERGSNEQMVGDMYQSFIDFDTRNQKGIEPLQEEFDKIDAIADYQGLATHFGKAMSIYDLPFSFGVFPDLLEPTKYGIYYFQSGLGLPDREYYFNTDEKSVMIREEYVKHIANMLNISGFSESSKIALDIMALETRMAEANMKKEETRDPRNIYNKYSKDSLSTLMPKFAWSDFLEAAGVGDRDEIIIGMVDYCRQLDDIIVTTDLSIWKNYLKWNIINGFSGYLSEELDNGDFEFYGKTLFGREKQRETWRRAVSFVNRNIGEVVGKVYVERHFPPVAKERMTKLVSNLIKAYEISIKELDWMTDSTKAQALDKLQKFNPKIGYPDIWKDYTGLEIRADDLVGNKMRADLLAYQRAMEKLRGPIQKHEWQMTPQTVNAYYNPTLNEIVFPAAILQPPFFDLEVEDAVNYGAIGAVIGHEIGHGFDDSGSRFDGDGQMRNWWTDEDRTSFEERTSALIKQYDSYEVLEGLNINGRFTLGENIGDLGGLMIALKAYELSLEGKEGPLMDGLTATQRLFIGYAQTWMSKSREERIRFLISSDPHSPAKFRVNGVVKNIPEFYDAFSVTETNDLYMPPEERIKIW